MEQFESRKFKLGLTIGVVVVGAFVLFIVARKVKSLYDAWKDAQDNQSEQTILNLQGVKPSFNKNWYEVQAIKIYNATNWTWYNPNCDEETTIIALVEIKNDLDYLELVAAFGIRDGFDMIGFIDGCLNQSEKDRVNNVWRSRGITKRI